MGRTRWLVVRGFIVSVAYSWAHGQTCIVKEGLTLAQTVIAEQPPRMVKLAAEELQACIEKIAGAELPIVTHACRLYSGRAGEDGRTEPIPVCDGAEAD